MAGLIPFNWRKNTLASPNTFQNMLEGFFNDDFPSIRNFQNESFKIDLQENEKEYIRVIRGKSLLIKIQGGKYICWYRFNGQNSTLI